MKWRLTKHLVRSIILIFFAEVFRSLLAPYKLGSKFATLYWHNYLIVFSLYAISVLKVPFSVPFWFVILKFSLKICSVWISPFSIQKFVLIPLPDIFHSSGIKYVCSLPMFFSIQPITRKYILIFINVHSFSLLFAIDPLAIVLTLISIYNSADSMF